MAISRAASEPSLPSEPLLRLQFLPTRNDPFSPSHSNFAAEKDPTSGQRVTAPLGFSGC